MSDTCPTCHGHGGWGTNERVPCPKCQPDRKTETFYPNRDYDKHLPAENPADKPLHNQPPETLGNEGAGRYVVTGGGALFNYRYQVIREESGGLFGRLLMQRDDELFGEFLQRVVVVVDDAAHAAGIQEGRDQALAEVDEAAAKLKGCTSFWQYIDYEGTGEIDGLALEFEGDGNVAYAPTLTAALLATRDGGPDDD